MPTASLILTTVLALIVGACSGSDRTAESAVATTPPPSARTGAPTEVAGHNDADIVFLQGMIPHHAGAIEMAQLVLDRTDRPELNDLADDIIATQQPEIDQMEAMLAEAGVDAGHGGMDGMDGTDGTDDMDDTDGMPMRGMMSPEQMDDLQDADGAAFDLLFIDMMIAHHQGAIDSANEVIETGSNPQVRALAEEVIAAQQAEIDEMTEWRDAWADG